MQIGAPEFFNEYHSNVTSALELAASGDMSMGRVDPTHKTILTGILQHLVGSTGIQIQATTAHANTLTSELSFKPQTSETRNPFVTQGVQNTQNLVQENTLISHQQISQHEVQVREQDPMKEHAQIQGFQNTLSGASNFQQSFAASKMTLGGTNFNRTDFSFTQKQQNVLNTFGGNANQESGRSGASHHMSQASTPHNRVASESANLLHTAHMEIMHKQQTLKEPCELPFIVLSEEDEKVLFDISVQLKFGDFRTVQAASQTFKDCLAQDFPIEVFLQRTDIFKALLDLLEGNQEGQTQNTAALYTNLAQQALVTFVRRLRNLYRYLGSNVNKASSAGGHRFASQLQKQEGIQPDYIRLSYPSTSESLWNREEVMQDQKKYGANISGAPAEKMSAAITQGSLSCRAALGLVLTKAIYMLKDTEKLGLYIQLIQETLSVAQDVFRIEGNREFSEFLHLALIAFDSVCKFYKDQLLIEILVQPILPLTGKILKLLNSIEACSKGSQQSAIERFQEPFSETLFKNTENLQMILRRALFNFDAPTLSSEATEDMKSTILNFFARMEADLPQVNLLQKNVLKSYERAKEAFQCFARVNAYRITASTDQREEQCFVETITQMQQALEVLGDLSKCIEVKMDFPFEHILLDCAVLSMIVVQQNHDQQYAEKVESLLLTYLSMAVPEVRERILRRLYNRLRVIGTFQNKNSNSANNNILLASFIFRKKIVNQLVNGILINAEVANEECSALQMTIGQLLVKILIVGYTAQGSNLGQSSAKQSALNSQLLTFQVLLTQYSELIGLLDLVEEAAPRNCRYLRVLRDLYNSDKAKREFATSVLHSSFSRDFQLQNQNAGEAIKDLLGSVVNLRAPQEEISAELDLVNLNYDYTSFDVVNIVNILQNAKSDFDIKRKSLEQLTMLLFDCQQKRGKALFVSEGHQFVVSDVFSFTLGEILSAFNTAKTYLGETVSELPSEQIAYLDQCCKFLFYSYIFFAEETVVKQFFGQLRSFAAATGDATNVAKFESVINALVFFGGSTSLRKHSLRLLYLVVFNPFWLKVRVARGATSRDKKAVTVLVPDFCQDAFVMMMPFQLQMVKAPLRHDLLLTEEQRSYVQTCSNASENSQCVAEVLRQVALNFVSCTSRNVAIETATVQATSKLQHGRTDPNYNAVMRGFETLQNYLLALGDAHPEIMTQQVLSYVTELLKILPTKDFEFNFLADYFMLINQILGHAQNISGHQRLVSLVAALCDALKFHLLPYLFEIGLSGLEQAANEKHSPRISFQMEFVELISRLSQTDAMLRQQNRGLVSHFALKVLSSSLVEYLIDVSSLLKDNISIRQKIQALFLHFLNSGYDYSSLAIDHLPDMLVTHISSHRLCENFAGASHLMISLRALILIQQRRVRTLQGPEDRHGDLRQQVPLSNTAAKYLQEFDKSGWLVRFTNSRDSRLRCMSWDLLTEIFSYEFLVQNQSIVQHALNCLLREGELYCVKISVLKFLNKLSDSIIHNCDHTQLEQEGVHNHERDNQFAGSAGEQASVRTLLDAASKQGLISHIHGILNQKDCPLLMISLLLKLLSKLISMDASRALPILSQLDYWTVLVDLVDTQVLERQEKAESRVTLQSMSKTQLKSGQFTSDLIYMALNSILEFVFEAFKRDSQLAGLLVKTTRLLPSLFSLVQDSVDNSGSGPANQLRNHGLQVILIDKVAKLLHISLLHPRDYSVDAIGKWFMAEHQGQRNWSYLIKMLDIVGGNKGSAYYFGHVDVKLALCRFMAELLIRLPNSNLLKGTPNSYHLDEVVSKSFNESNPEDELETYGGQLLLEFGQVFKALYIDQRDARQVTSVPRDLAEHENSKIDVCMCLSILLSTCHSAKQQAASQNLLKKVIEICGENISAVHMHELQRVTQRPGSSQRGTTGNGQQSREMFQSQFQRSYRYAQVNDIEQCEREVVRMMKILRHVLYSSEELLVGSFIGGSSAQSIDHLQSKSFVSMNAQTKVTAREKKDQSLCERLLGLFGQVLELLSGHHEITTECLMTMINFASQHVRFKNAFLNSAGSQVSAKRTTVLRLALDRLYVQRHQESSKVTKLLFQLLRTLSTSAEIAKELMKVKAIEEIQSKLQPICKNEKDIKLLKFYLTHYFGFLAAYAYSEEGQKAILRQRSVFEMSLFLMDTVTPPALAQKQPDVVSPLTTLMTNNLLFLRNSTFNRSCKLHILTDKAFLPCLLAFLQSRQQHPRVRAYTAATLWSALYSHQGVKAAINNEAIRSELILLQSEYQRQVDIEKYSHFVEPGSDQGNLLVKQDREIEASNNRKMDSFTLQALDGILCLLDAKQA